jgi:hypothetical protein
MFDYQHTVLAPLSHQQPLAYSMAPRTVPTLVSRSLHPAGQTPFWYIEHELSERVQCALVSS